MVGPAYGGLLHWFLLVRGDKTRAGTVDAAVGCATMDQSVVVSKRLVGRSDAR